MTTIQNVLDAVIRSLIATSGPHAVGIALNNACVHGEALLEYGCELDDEDSLLGALYNSIGSFINVAREMERV